MAANKKLLVLLGDGIGPEVMGEVRRVIDWMDRDSLSEAIPPAYTEYIGENFPR